MNRRLLQAAAALAFAAPGASLAQFQPIEEIPWPSAGRFPAYEATGTRPLEVYVQTGVFYDSNIFRLPDDVNTQAAIGRNDRADWVARAGAGIRYEQRVVGRQSVRLQARGDQYKFARSDQLDHFAYGLSAEWLWEFTNDLSGAIGYERERRLVDLAQRTSDDLVIENHAFANAAYRLGPNTRLRGALDAVRSDRDTPAFADVELRSNSAVIGADYVTPLGNAIGVEGRRTTGNAPFAPAIGATAVNNEFTEREIAGVLTWAATAQIRATARLGRTKREHEQFGVRDFSGATGRGTVDWQPLNKTAFTFSVYREPRSVIDIDASYVLVRGFSIGPRWAPREKLVFSGAIVRETLDYAGDPLGADREEEVRALRVAAGWEPKRFTQLAIAFEHGTRDSNVGRDYDYDTVMANLRLTF